MVYYTIIEAELYSPDQVRLIIHCQRRR